MERFSEYFEYVTDTGNNSVVFHYTKRIPTDLLLAFDWTKIDLREKVALMDRAIARFSDEPRAAYIREAKNTLLKGKPEQMVGPASR
jgi:hypothetical protein